MSWGEYQILVEGYWQKDQRQWEEDWKRIRELFYILYNANVKKEDKKSRHELIPLPSDKESLREKERKALSPKARKKAEEQATLAFFSAMGAFDASEQ